MLRLRGRRGRGARGAARRRRGGRRRRARLRRRAGRRRDGAPVRALHVLGAARAAGRRVPLLAAAAWAMMARRRGWSRACSPRRRALRVPLAAGALTAWDVFLDPRMVREGYWTWPGGGRYEGVPASNFAGWFATGLGVFARLVACSTATTAAPTATARSRSTSGRGSARRSPTRVLWRRPRRRRGGGRGDGRVRGAGAAAAGRAAMRVAVVGAGRRRAGGGGRGSPHAGHARHRASSRRPRRAASAGACERDGFTWDAGPVAADDAVGVRELFADRSAARDELELLRVEPVTRYEFADGSARRAVGRPAARAGGARGVVAGRGRRLDALPRDLRGDVAGVACRSSPARRRGRRGGRAGRAAARPARPAAREAVVDAARSSRARTRATRGCAWSSSASRPTRAPTRAARRRRSRSPATSSTPSARGIRAAGMYELVRALARAARGARRRAAPRRRRSSASSSRAAARGGWRPRRRVRADAVVTDVDDATSCRRAARHGRAAGARALAVGPRAACSACAGARRGSPTTRSVPRRLRRRVRRRLRPPPPGARPDALRQRARAYRPGDAPPDARAGSCSSTRPVGAGADWDAHEAALIDAARRARPASSSAPAARRPTSSARPAPPAARSTAARRTAGWGRCGARATPCAARAGCGWSAGPCTRAAGCRW